MDYNINMSVCRKNNTGFSIIEVVIVSAITTFIFAGLFASFQYSLPLMALSKAKLSAQSVANDRMEYFRSLPYDDVGTISGIPSGTIPQNSTVTLNGIRFKERILVEYVDDDADGTGVSDTNSIPSDYKRIKAEYSWFSGGATSTIALVSNIVPRSVETTAGGGTIRINVMDGYSNLLSGAEVRLVNSSSTNPIDVTKYSDALGQVLFSGAPADSDYEVYVTANISGNQYSHAQTHEATTTNPNPTISPFALLEADVSTLTFQIGELSSLNISTLSSITEGTYEETFDDMLSLDSTTTVDIDSGSLVLENTAGVYKVSGQAFFGPLKPSTLLNWEFLRVEGVKPATTDYLVQLYTGTTTGPYNLISDSVLTNNSSGFSNPTINISSIEAASFPEIYVGLTLSTTDTNKTPEIDNLKVYYRESETSIPSVNLSIEGGQVIGTDNAFEPIYNYVTSTSTDASGELELSNVEFGNYNFDSSGYDIVSACGNHPFEQLAGVNGDLELILISNALNTLRVVVVDSLGNYVPDASVNLSRPGYDVTIDTDLCGQGFFTGGLAAENDYVLVVSAGGYSTENVDPIGIDEDTVVEVTLNE